MRCIIIIRSLAVDADSFLSITFNGTAPCVEVQIACEFGLEYIVAIGSFMICSSSYAALTLGCCNKNDKLHK